MVSEIETRTRSMRDVGVRLRRKAMLREPHVAKLTEYVIRLRDRNLGEVPDFDPLDGGIEARVLFLLEKPGPMTAEAGKRAGSGFISRDNDDGTAAAIFEFMEKARIPRELTVLWNVIPWWNGTRKVSAKELQSGVERVQELLGLLDKLGAIVLVGNKAAKAMPLLCGQELPVYTSCHPSPIVKASFRSRWDKIPAEWAKVLQHL